MANLETKELQEYRAIDEDTGAELVTAKNSVYVRNYMRGYKRAWRLEQLVLEYVDKSATHLHWIVLREGNAVESPNEEG